MTQTSQAILPDARSEYEETILKNEMSSWLEAQNMQANPRPTLCTSDLKLSKMHTDAWNARDQVLLPVTAEVQNVLPFERMANTRDDEASVPLLFETMTPDEVDMMMLSTEVCSAQPRRPKAHRGQSCGNTYRRLRFRKTAD